MNSAQPLTPEFRGKFATLRCNSIDRRHDFEVIGERAAGELQGGVIRKFDAAATPPQPSHMQDFLNCVRERRKTKCNEDEGLSWKPSPSSCPPWHTGRSALSGGIGIGTRSSEGPAV